MGWWWWCCVWRVRLLSPGVKKTVVIMPGGLVTGKTFLLFNNAHWLREDRTGFRSSRGINACAHEIKCRLLFTGRVEELVTIRSMAHMGECLPADGRSLCRTANICMVQLERRTICSYPMQNIPHAYLRSCTRAVTCRSSDGAVRSEAWIGTRNKYLLGSQPIMF